MKSKNIIYLVVLILFLIAVGISFYSTVEFFSAKINAAFALDDAKVESEVVKVNIEGFEKIAPRFGMTP